MLGTVKEQKGNCGLARTYIHILKEWLLEYLYTHLFPLDKESKERLARPIEADISWPIIVFHSISCIRIYQRFIICCLFRGILLLALLDWERDHLSLDFQISLVVTMSVSNSSHTAITCDNDKEKICFPMQVQSYSFRFAYILWLKDYELWGFFVSRVSHSLFLFKEKDFLLDIYTLLAFICLASCMSCSVQYNPKLESTYYT